MLVLIGANAYASVAGDWQFNRRWLNGGMGVEPLFIPEPSASAIITYDRVNRTPVYKLMGSGIDCSTAYCNVTGGTGATGAPGNNGASAYEIGVANGFVGTQADWLTSLVSTVPGPTGPTGSTGAAGTTSYLGLTNVPSTFAPSAHTHPASQISDSTATGQAVLTAPSAASARSTLGVLSTSEVAAAYYPLSGNPSSFITQAGARTAISLTTTGSGAASYNSSTGALNVPTPAAIVPFNFSQPSARTLAVSTSYQATDPAKAAIIYPSYACQNATQVLASSACTIQVRMGTGTLTCSTGTVYYTQSLTVNLGVLLTQNSANPVPIFLPAGASVILCATAGTFTITTVEQTAG